MDLKEFIIETISAIADATNELQKSYEKEGVIINPPTSKDAENLYLEGGSKSIYRRIENIKFDVALTVGSSREAEGNAGVKVFSLEVGGGGGTSKSQEQVSRVQFSIPLSLKPTTYEAENINNAKKQASKDKRRAASRGLSNNRIAPL
ncbi:MAG: hypothetical protein CMN55_16415 [Sneathiella sp.]|uniref:trypco2 family protein n=1 Tax=Sneathiella sp. TaxID=1964365 RepID=UPI000C3D6C52|nr:trypco2 family protein [Sneathiella sp.]MAL80662.1 hypothetical protein [Sneathiella sp.]